MLAEHYVPKAPTETYERAFRFEPLGHEFEAEWLRVERLEAEWLSSKAHLEPLSQSLSEFVITFMNQRT